MSCRSVPGIVLEARNKHCRFKDPATSSTAGPRPLVCPERTAEVEHILHVLSVNLWIILCVLGVLLLPMSKNEVIPINTDCPSEVMSLPDALQDNLNGLYRFALRLSRNADEAQDLTQETAVRAWERRDTIVRNWRAWLFQTVYHTFISNKRRSKRLGEEEIGDSEMAESGRTDDPLPALVAMEDVRRAVESLPEHLRIVMRLLHSGRGSQKCVRDRPPANGKAYGDGWLLQQPLRSWPASRPASSGITTLVRRPPSVWHRRSL